ncbi:hypothetical protein [Actinoplanes solisilvae]|uniref:hypothetical protein n=1 Tax=Actinoplanes solisilvae TaxID=2486853 RepID=UPI000FDC898B|nr:hypothetical protein [Actinoplanes solisilvae]
MEILYLLAILVVAKLAASLVAMLIRRHSERHRPDQGPDPCLSPQLGVPPPPPDGSFGPAGPDNHEVAGRLTRPKGGGGV